MPSGISFQRPGHGRLKGSRDEPPREPRGAGSSTRCARAAASTSRSRRGSAARSRSPTPRRAGSSEVVRVVEALARRAGALGQEVLEPARRRDLRAQAGRPPLSLRSSWRTYRARRARARPRPSARASVPSIFTARGAVEHLPVLGERGVEVLGQVPAGLEPGRDPQRVADRARSSSTRCVDRVVDDPVLGHEQQLVDQHVLAQPAHPARDGTAPSQRSGVSGVTVLAHHPNGVPALPYDGPAMAGCRALTVLACVAAALALVTGYLWFAVAGSDQFANRATAALQADDVRSLVAERVTDEIVLARQADLLAARPLIESVTAAVVGGRAFTGLFRAGVRDLHRAAVRPRPGHRGADRRRRRHGRRGRAAGAAAVAGDGGPRDAATSSCSAREASAASAGRDGRRPHGAAADRARCAGLALACAGGALRLAPDRRARRRAARHRRGGRRRPARGRARRRGASLAAARADDPDARAAVRAIWDAFLGDLRTAAWIMAGVRRGRGRRRGVADPAGRHRRAAAARGARDRRRAGPARCRGCCAASRSSLAGVSLLVARDAVLRAGGGRARRVPRSTRARAACCGSIRASRRAAGGRDAPAPRAAARAGAVAAFAAAADRRRGRGVRRHGRGDRRRRRRRRRATATRAVRAGR